MPYPLDIPPVSAFHHRLPLQIRFNDIDLLGHVNNTVYLSLYDTGKARYMESVSHGNIDFRRIENVIANIDCAFRKPIYFEQKIDCLTRVITIGEKHIVIQQMLVDRDTDEVHSLCETVMVYVDVKTLHPVEVPEEWVKRLTDFEGSVEKLGATNK